MCRSIIAPTNRAGRVANGFRLRAFARPTFRIQGSGHPNLDRANHIRSAHIEPRIPLPAARSRLDWTPFIECTIRGTGRVKKLSFSLAGMDGEVPAYE